MPEVDELLDDITVRLPDAATVRARATRRTARRRLTVGLAAVAAVGLAWTAWPDLGQGDARPARRPAVTASPTLSDPDGFPADTPYKKHGVNSVGSAKLMPAYKTWHWRNTHGDLPESQWPLAQAACGATGLDNEEWEDASTGDEAAGYDSWNTSVHYTGSAGAVASETQREYTRDAGRAYELGKLRTAIAACALHRQGTGQPEIYVGEDRSGHDVRVTLEQGDRWIRVVQMRTGAR
ncbi:hypothetical protein ACIRF8_09735 [Streptomyces sp. NPDC102406]|uniref:hypothetical protein n=1 Tax=Streptomyces sp. NPDC102406 TaxID=3366171 RepID=UPI0037FA9FDA